MSDKQKILCVVRTRPEAIKMALVIPILHAESWAEVSVLMCETHRRLNASFWRLGAILMLTSFKARYQGPTFTMLASLPKQA